MVKQFTMTTSKTIGEILSTFDSGNRITDSELEFAIDILRRWLTMGMDTLDERYHFFVVDMRLRLAEYERYAKSRELDV